MYALLLIITISVLAGCQTPASLDQDTTQAIIEETEKSNQQSLADTFGVRESFGRTAFGKALLKEALDNCRGTHQQFINSRSPVDCSYTYPENLTLSFPSVEYHNDHRDVVEKFFSRWCEATWHLLGEPSKFTRVAREDNYSEGTSCSVPE